MPLVRTHVVASLIGFAAITMLAAPVSAQQVYRIVGPDGRVTFSDKPPVDAKATPALVAPASGGGGANGAGLPFELRTVATRYPVTLYTANNCAPCGAGRAFLSSRGIPFSEKTVVTSEDSEALKRLQGDMSIPLLTVGGQQIKGYSDSEWGQFLDAAGYPAKSVLPASYRNPSPSPLVAVQRPSTPVPTAAAEAAPARAPTPSPVERADNPAGIRF